jgi:hypothetical protein
MPIAMKLGSQRTGAGKQRMRWMFVLLFFPVCLKAVSEQSALAGKSVLEKTEWTWADRPVKPDSALPNVLLAGDSIARAFFPAVSTLLAGKANVYLFATSASAGDPRLLKQLDDYFAVEPLKFSVIHFNNGMHGWGYSEAAYAEALPAMVRLLQRDSPGSKLIWASTTPVHKKLESGASNERLEARNAVALAVMKTFSIPVDDQYLLMAAHDDLHADDVHYKPEGCRIEGEQVVRMVITALVANQAGPARH